MKFIITGGAGFIGSAVIRHIINNTNHNVVNVDKLTYAGNLESLKSIEDDSRYVFDKVDICDVDHKALLRTKDKIYPCKAALDRQTEKQSEHKIIDDPEFYRESEFFKIYN